MTYQTGSIISASDYNNLIGGQSSNTAFTSDAMASQKFSAIYGVGYGNRGFGQTAYTFVTKLPGSSITSLEWNNLIHAMYDVAFYTGAINNLPINDWINAKVTLDNITLSTYEYAGEINTPQVPDPNVNGWIESVITTTLSDLNIPPLTQFNVGAPVIPQESSAPTNSVYDVDGHISILDASRLNQSTQVRSTTYDYFTSINPNPIPLLSNPSVIFSFDFGTSDAARYFFNSGGEIRLRLTHSSILTPHDIYWSEVLSNLGTIRFNGFNTLRSSGSSLEALGSEYGYYNITASNTLICSAMDANIPGLELYGMNDLQIYAKTSGVSTNGGNGSIITFTVTLLDQYTGAGDSLGSGLGVYADIVKASQYLTIQSPTAILNSAWA